MFCALASSKSHTRRDRGFDMCDHKGVSPVINVRRRAPSRQLGDEFPAAVFKPAQRGGCEACPGQRVISPNGTASWPGRGRRIRLVHRYSSSHWRCLENRLIQCSFAGSRRFGMALAFCCPRWSSPTAATTLRIIGDDRHGLHKEAQS